MTFGAPLGGILFSIELTSHIYNLQNLWRAFYSATISVLIYKLVHANSLVVLFEAKETNFYRTDHAIFDHYPEFIYVIILAVISGAIGSLYIIT